VIEIGDSERVGTRYLELNFSRQARDELAEEEPAAEEEPEPEPETSSEEALPDRLGDQSAEILEAWFEDEAGQRVDVLAAGRPCTFVGRVAIRTTVDDPIFGLNMHNSQSDMVLAASNFWSDPQVGRFEAGEEVIFRVSFQNLLTPDRYDVTPAVARAGSTVDWLDRRERLLSIQVIGVKRTDAVVDLPYQVAIERLRIPA